MPSAPPPPVANGDDAAEESGSRRVRQAEAGGAVLDLRARRSRTIGLLTTMLAVIALVLAGSAGFSALTLRSAQRTALAGEIANRSAVVAETRPAEAAQLAIAAHGIDDNPASRSRLLSLTAGALPRRITTAPGPAAVAAVDGLLAHGGAQGIVRLLDPATGEELRSFEAAVTDIHALSLVDTGQRRLLSVAGENASGVRGRGCVWDVTAAPVELGCVENALVNGATAVLPDGSGALFGGSDGRLHRLRIAGDRTVALDSIEGPPRKGASESSPVTGVDARGGTVVAVREDGTLAVLAAPLGAADWSDSLALPSLADVTLSPDGTRFAAATGDHTLEIGSVNDGEPEVTATAAGFAGGVSDAAFLADGRLAAVAADRTLRLLTAAGETIDRQLLSSLPDALVQIDGDLATTTADGSLTIWPRETFPPPEAPGPIVQLVGDLAGEEIVAVPGGEGGGMQVHRLTESGQTPVTVPAAADGTRSAIAASADGSLLAGGARDGLRVWRVGEEELSEPTTVDSPSGAPSSAAFSPDGGRLAVRVPDADRVTVYDVIEDAAAGGAGVRLRERTRIPVLSGTAMAFSDQDTLVVEDGDGDLLLWDLAADEELARFPVDGGRPTGLQARPGHPGQMAVVTESREVGILDLSDPGAPRMVGRAAGLTDSPLRLAFTPDGDRLAISASSHVDVREVGDGGSISGSQLRLSGPRRTEITDARFLEGGTRMVASTSSGHLWWWTLDPAEANREICAAVGEPLSIQEGQELAPSLPDDAEMCR